jgi:hypothetical protein
LTGNRNKDSVSQKIYPLGYHEGCITIDRYKIDNNNITFYTVLWADITTKYKYWLDINHSETKYRRTCLNNKLKKGITNDRLSDFVLYTANDFKSKLRKPIVAALDSIFEDSQQMADRYEDNVLNKSIYTITGSLGTKMVLDVLADYKNEQTDNMNQEKISRLVSENLIGMYMLTNQIPLLSLYYLDEDDDPLRDSLNYIYQNYYGICNFLHNNEIFLAKDNLSDTRQVDYVGFYDPNDLLGYRLLSQAPDCPDGDNCDNCWEQINKADCIVNNAIPWFGIFANPNGAHVNVWTNKKITNLIANGYKK